VEDADLRLRVEALRRRDARVEPAARARIAAQAARWRRGLGIADERPDADAAGLLVALAYPDRVARRREGPGARFLLRNGRGAALVGAQSLAREPFLAVADVDGAGREGRIHLAAPLDEQEIRDRFAEQLAVEEEIEWREGALVARRRERLGAIVLREATLADPAPEAVAEALLAAVEREGLALLPWSHAALDLRRRVAFLRAVDPAWPDLADEALLGSLRDWLGPRLAGVRSATDLARLDLRALLLSRLSWRQQAALDELAPTHLRVPGGARAAIDYSDPAAPSVSVRLQEVFGLAETPRVAGGRVPLTLVLLSPARRPVQVTRDLASFWLEAYHEVRRELRGRYPKHAWPEDPLRPRPERG
jgi:ATP-dependent helicase HrpB